MMVHIAKFLNDAGHLKQAYAFIAYYDEWRNYLENQRYLKFQKIVGTREIYQRMAKERLDPKEITRIEREYGSIDMELWNMVYCDPYLATHTHHRIYNHPQYTREEILLYMQVAFQSIEELFREIKPDAIIDFAPVNILRGVLDLVAQKYSVPFLYPTPCLLANRYYICRRFREDYAPIRETYLRLLSDGSPCKEGYNYLLQFPSPRPKLSINLICFQKMKQKI